MTTRGFWACFALAIVVSIASVAKADPDLPSYLANGATPNIETIKSCSLVIPADDNQAISGSFNLRAFVELLCVRSVHPACLNPLRPDRKVHPECLYIEK
jgi:hypothetical protein